MKGPNLFHKRICASIIEIRDNGIAPCVHSAILHPSYNEHSGSKSSKASRRDVEKSQICALYSVFSVGIVGRRNAIASYHYDGNAQSRQNTTNAVSAER